MSSHRVGRLRRRWNVCEVAILRPATESSHGRACSSRPSWSSAAARGASAGLRRVRRYAPSDRSDAPCGQGLPAVATRPEAAVSACRSPTLSTSHPPALSSEDCFESVVVHLLSTGPSRAADRCSPGRAQALHRGCWTGPSAIPNVPREVPGPRLTDVRRSPGLHPRICRAPRADRTDVRYNGSGG